MPEDFLKKFNKMPVDGVFKTVIIAVSLCFFCSMVVSFAAVNLKSIQNENKILDHGLFGSTFARLVQMSTKLIHE